MLQKRLHLTDICRLAVQQLLTDHADPVILLGILVEILQPFDHPFGIALNHHIRNFRVTVTPGQLHAGHSVREKPDSRIQFPQLPSPLTGNGMCLTFNTVIFPQLGFQGFSECRTHTGIQYTSDSHLAHLCGFQDRAEHILTVFHNYITGLSMYRQKKIMQAFPVDA